jgi:dipeptidyl aminopeptidase/acylaminoacyl peptidase
MFMLHLFQYYCCHCVYKNRYLRDNFKIIDPTKICAYGWGYGAYLTSILLTKDSKRTFLCYIAVAPIVSFQYYSKYMYE